MFLCRPIRRAVTEKINRSNLINQRPPAAETALFLELINCFVRLKKGAFDSRNSDQHSALTMPLGVFVEKLDASQLPTNLFRPILRA